MYVYQPALLHFNLKHLHVLIQKIPFKKFRLNLLKNHFVHILCGKKTNFLDKVR